MWHGATLRASRCAASGNALVDPAGQHAEGGEMGVGGAWIERAAPLPCRAPSGVEVGLFFPTLIRIEGARGSNPLSSTQNRRSRAYGSRSARYRRSFVTQMSPGQGVDR